MPEHNETVEYKKEDLEKLINNDGKDSINSDE